MTILGADSLKDLLEHFARSATPLLAVSAMLAGGVGPLNPGQTYPRARPRTFPGAVNCATGPWCATAPWCVSFAAIALQPFLLDPPWTSDSEARLAVLGVVLALGSFPPVFTPTGTAD